MIYQAGGGKYLWGFEGVVCWEMDSEEENSSGIWTVALKHKVSSLQILENSCLVSRRRSRGKLQVP